MLDTTGVRTIMLDDTWVTPVRLNKATCLSGLCAWFWCVMSLGWSLGVVVNVSEIEMLS